MAETMFVLTTIFVAYVVYVIVGDEKASKDKSTPPASSASAEPPPVVKAKSNEKPPAETTPAAAATDSSDTIKNPATGEITKVANNYRFFKRWIKEALVEEGLLDKVYKNNELDEAASAKIDGALEQLKAMDKYRA